MRLMDVAVIGFSGGVAGCTITAIALGLLVRETRRAGRSRSHRDAFASVVIAANKIIDGNYSDVTRAVRTLNDRAAVASLYMTGRYERLHGITEALQDQAHDIAYPHGSDTLMTLEQMTRTRDVYLHEARKALTS